MIGINGKLRSYGTYSSIEDAKAVRKGMEILFGTSRKSA